MSFAKGMQFLGVVHHGGRRLCPASGVSPFREEGRRGKIFVAFGLTHEQGFKVSVVGLRAEGLGYQMSKNWKTTWNLGLYCCLL